MNVAISSDVTNVQVIGDCRLGKSTSDCRVQQSLVAKSQRRAYVRRTPRRCGVAVDLSVGSGVICTPPLYAELFNDRRLVARCKGCQYVSVPASRSCMTWNAAPVESEVSLVWTRSKSRGSVLDPGGSSRGDSRLNRRSRAECDRAVSAGPSSGQS